MLQKDPQNAEALLELGQSATRPRADRARASRRWPRPPSWDRRKRARPPTSASSRCGRWKCTGSRLTHPNLPKLQAAVQAGQASQLAAATQIQARAAEGKDQIKAIDTRINSLQYEIPDFSRINIRRGSRIEAIVKNLTLMSRSVDSSLQDARAPIGGVGSLEKNKEIGLLKDGADIYTEMLAPFSSTPIPADSLAILPSYPQMMSELSLADGDMLRSVDAARASLTMLDQSVGDLDDFLKQLDHVQLGFNGDLERKLVRPDFAADAKGRRRVQRSRDGGVARRAALQHGAHPPALGAHHAVGFGNLAPALLDPAIRAAATLRLDRSGLSYDAARRLDPRRRDRRYDSCRRYQEHARGDRRRSKELQETIVDVANAHGMHAWPLEIFTGLVYLDFTDDPAKELRKADGSEAATLSELGL